MKINFNFKERVRRLKISMNKEGIEALLINRKERIYYLTGYSAEDSFLLISPKKNYLFTDARYKEILRINKYTFEAIISKEPLKGLARLISGLNLKRTGIEQRYLNVNQYIFLKKSLNKVKLVPSARILNSMMVIKDEDEIKAIRQAIHITANAFNYSKRLKKAGRTEKEIAALLDFYILTHGADRGGYETMVISGVRTACAHAQSSDKKINSKANLLIDLGAKIYGYNSDLTRVYTLSKMKTGFSKILSIVIKAQQEAIQKVSHGRKISEVGLAARNYFKKFKLEKYFIHSTGHGVGLNVHEAPAISLNNTECLKAGMVFTIEPGIYLPGRFGIRVEDIVLVTKHGYEVLSNDIPNSI